MSSTPASAIQGFLTFLAGRYDQLYDTETVSGESTRRFNTYIYSRKLLIRKSILNDPGLNFEIIQD